MTYGLSRDDSGKFLGDYIERGIYKNDPFAELDPDGVGEPDANRDRARAQGQPPSSSSASAASMAAIPRASSCAIASGSTTCRARRFGFRSRGWPRRRPRSRNVAASALSRTCKIDRGDAGLQSAAELKRLVRDGAELGEVIFDANRGDRNLADPIVAQNLQLDDLARVMAVDRLVQTCAGRGSRCRRSTSTTSPCLQAGLLARTRRASRPRSPRGRAACTTARRATARGRQLTRRPWRTNSSRMARKHSPGMPRIARLRSAKFRYETADDLSARVADRSAVEPDVERRGGHADALARARIPTPRRTGRDT